MYMTAAVATSWKDLYRSSIDSPNLSPPAMFGCLMCRLRMPCVGRRSMPTLLSPRLPSARLRDQYQYLTDYSTSLRRMAKPSPLQSHCNSLGLLVAMKCCHASIPDRESHNHRHQCRANAQTTRGRSQLDIRFQREPFVTMQAHFPLQQVLLSYSLLL